VVWSGYQYAVHGVLYRLLTVLRLSHQSRPHQRNTASDVQRQWLDHRIPLHRNTINGYSNGICSVYHVIQKTNKTLSHCRGPCIKVRIRVQVSILWTTSHDVSFSRSRDMIRARYPNHVHFGVKLPYRQDGTYFDQAIYQICNLYFHSLRRHERRAKCRQESLLYNIGPTRYVSKM